MLAWLRKFRYAILGFLTLGLALGAVGILYSNLQALERAHFQEYRAFAEKITKSAMNFIIENQYDNLLDLMRLLTSTSNIPLMALYIDRKLQTKVGKIPETAPFLARAPDLSGSRMAVQGGKHFLVADFALPYHPDIIGGHAALRIVFSLESFLERKDHILLAIAVIISLLAALLLAFYLLSRAEENKSRTIREIAHDARKVLNRITPRLDNMQEQFRRQRKDPVLARNLKLTWEESLALSRFIDNLSDHENISRGQVVLRPALLDLAALLKQKRQQFEVTLTREGKTMSYAFPFPRLQVCTDEHSLERIIVNLIDNAVKFAPVQTPVEIRAESRPGWVHIFIRDQGPGIDPKYWDEIFKPFKRLDVRKPGSGLGLSNARALARLLGGEVGVRESRPGQGTTFYLRLPSKPMDRAGRR